MQTDTTYTMGRATEISRDEIKFAKFIDRLRLKFNQLFMKTLEKQLVLKAIITSDEWKQISSKIRFIYSTDNLFAELKDLEIMKERVGMMGLMSQNMLIGKYYSHRWIQTNVMKMTEDDIEQMREEIQQEMGDQIFNPPLPEGATPPPPAASLG
jgi:Bacteriophage T4-like portal protein (Gp20)